MKIMHTFFATVETLVWFNEADKKHFQKILTYASSLTNIQRLYQRDKTKLNKNYKKSKKFCAVMVKSILMLQFYF